VQVRTSDHVVQRQDILVVEAEGIARTAADEINEVPHGGRGVLVFT
jgi:hypothetical protein